MNILPDNEYTEFEGKYYVNPQVSLDEQNAFIDNLRSTQQVNNQQINDQTRNLGTAVPSNLGGLMGGEGYFTSRIQTPQTNSLVNDLKATARASALNQVLANEQEKWKTRYTRASNAARVRGSKAGSGGGTTKTTEGGLDTKDNSNTTKAEYEKNPNGDTVIKIRDDDGFYTGKELVIHPDGTQEERDSYYTHDLPRAAGMSDFTDKFTGKYNYTLDGYEIEEGGNDETVVKGDDGYYYLYDAKKNLYTRITGKRGVSAGGGTWWTN